MLRCDLEGTIRFADAIMREDDLFYGTFFLENQGKAISPHFAFWWDPCSDELRPLNSYGMRLNAMSADRTFVGEWHGRAALCDIGAAPIPLEELANIPPGWELLAATDINCLGSIVGYGKKDGHTRYFALKRGKMMRPTSPVSLKEVP